MSINYKYVGFGAFTHDSNSAKVKQHLLKVDDMALIEEAELKSEKLLVINFRPEDERYLVQEQVATISLHTLLCIVFGEPLSPEDVSKHLLNGYRLLVTDPQNEDWGKLLTFKSVARKLSAIISDCFSIIEERNLVQVLLKEIQLVPVLWLMSGDGYSLDTNRIAKVKNTIAKQFEDASTSFKECHGVYFLNYFGNNAEILAEKEQCSKLSDKLRKIQKLESGRAVTSFNSIGTKTFRITTRNSNVQGFPKEIRHCLLPRCGDALVEYDLTSSQIIILAYLAGEQRLISKYNAGEDIYLCFASLILDKTEQNVSDFERTAVKQAILEYINGAGGKQLQKEFCKLFYDISESDAKFMMNSLIAEFPNIQDFIRKIRQSYYYDLPNGRRILCDSTNGMLAYILQGIEADILKGTLIRVFNRFKKLSGAELYLCIHDAIFCDVKDYCRGTVKIIIEESFKAEFKRYFPHLTEVQVKEKNHGYK